MLDVSSMFFHPWIIADLEIREHRRRRRLPLTPIMM